METREALLVALWTEKSPASERKLALWTVKSLTSALDCAAKSMRMVGFALTFYRVGGR
jgi:hypothetical protein